MADGVPNATRVSEATRVHEEIKNRFFLKHPTVYHDYKVLLPKYIALLQSTDDQATKLRMTKTLFSKLRSRFGPANEDLMRKLRELINLEQQRPLDEETNKQVIKNSLSFLNKMKDTLDHDKFKQFLEMINEFEQHQDVNRVEEEASVLFKEHPELDILFRGFTFDHKHGIPVKEVLEQRKRKRDELNAIRAAPFKLRRLEHQRPEFFEREDKMAEKECKFGRMLSAKYSLERLRVYCSGRDSGEKLEVHNYIKGLDLICLRKEFSARNYKILQADESIKVRRALDEADRILKHLEEKMDGITRNWSEAKKKFTISSHEDASKIQVFDWHKN